MTKRENERKRRAERRALWSSFKQRYAYFEEAQAKGRIASAVLRRVLKKFPDNLPESISTPVMDALGHVTKTVLERWRVGDMTTFEIDTGLDADLQQILMAMLGIESTGAKKPRRRGATRRHTPPFFDELALVHELVAAFASLDSFMMASVQTCFAAEPRKLKKGGSTISWEEIMSCGTIEEVRAAMVDQYLYPFGMKSIRERHATFAKEFDLDIKVSEDDLTQLADASAVRNIFVHSGGVITKKLVDAHSPRAAVVLGKKFLLSGEFVDNAVDLASHYGSELFTAVAEKHLGIANATSKAASERQTPAEVRRIRKALDRQANPMPPKTPQRAR